MVSFGDIEIPWLTDKNTSISKDVVEKNFVDEPPQVYELTPDLENGTYSAILNETVHERNESFSEQKDAVLSMVSRHGTEFPFSISGDSGYVLVESANTTDFPSLEIREAEMEIRFLDDNTYRSAVNASPDSFRDGDFEVEAGPVESIIAFPSDIDVEGINQDYQVTGEDGDVNLYTFDEKTIFEFDEDDSEQTLSQTNSICRLYNSSEDRLYSDAKVVNDGSEVSNALVRVSYGASESSIEYYDGTSFQSIGSPQLPFNDGYASENTNDEVTVTFINDNESSVYRGFSAVEYLFSDESSFTFDPAETFTEQNVESFYGHWEDGNGHDVIIVRTSEDGDFNTSLEDFGIENLSSDEEYTVFVAVVPDIINVGDYARYLYNFGRRKRTFTQK